MTLKRDAYVKECVDVELNQVPESVRDQWEFEKGQVLDVILPVLLEVFMLPGEGAREGSPEWIKLMIKRIVSVQVPGQVPSTNGRLRQKSHCLLGRRQDSADARGKDSKRQLYQVQNLQNLRVSSHTVAFKVVH